VDCARARRLLAVLDRDVGAKLPLGDEVAFGIEAELAGNHHEIPGAHEGHIIGDRRDRRRQHDAQIRQSFFNHSGHCHPPYTALRTRKEPLRIRVSRMCLSSSPPARRSLSWLITALRASVVVDARPAATISPSWGIR